ncbi:MAG: enoyl-CoA hydratase/isomerase family protein, partial [Hyphomicrobiaceae bacterium]
SVLRHAAAEPGSAGDIVIRREGAAGLVTLDRPRQLNALTTAMRAHLTRALPAFARDSEVYAVAIRSTGPKAFCAGGDIREIASWGRHRPVEARRSLREEYALNWLHECFSKPTVSLIDGPVMGSGVGITIYGTHRVAGERYAFAMPETAIGLFPDDGVASVLARLPDEIGMYLGLTGRTIGRADAFQLGLATCCVPAVRFAEIAAGLAAAEPVDNLIESRREDPGPGTLPAYREAIARCFAGPAVEDILTRLRSERGPERPWAEGVLADLAKRSPTSLKMTHRHIRTAKALDLRQTLMVDYRLACRCLDRPDFYEGVRAGLIDRDQNPCWRPARLADVSAAMIEDYFAPMPGAELVLPTRQEMQAMRV